MKSSLAALFSLLTPARRVLICGHRSPDGDAVGSALAWAEYLRSIGKSVTIMMPSPFPDFLRWLPGTEKILFYEKHEQQATEIISRHDLICCLDFGDLSRLQCMENAVQRARARRLCIDHHMNPNPKVADLIISDPTASSTCELVFRTIKELGGYEEMSADAATAIYTGMMTDTGSFTYNSTRPEIFEIIAQLLAKGIDKDRIYRNVYHVFSVNRLRLQGYLMNDKLKMYAHDRAALFTLTREEQKRFHFVRGDGEGIVNLPLQIKGLRLSISLREDTEREAVRVSLRSVDDFDCRTLAEKYFNGGGHFNAAGGELPFPMEEAVRRAEEAIASAFPEAAAQDA